MYEIKTSQKIKTILFILLILLNMVIRIPSIPHEKGSDSFFIHGLANSITSFGAASWWTNWLSIFGLYPYSYPSGVPLILSGFSQLTDIDMENTILIISIIFGLISVFTSYLLGGLISNNFVFRFIFSFIFSSCQGILVFTTWEMSSRGVFIVLFPLYVYLLIKSLKSKNIKTFFLILLFLVLLFSIHKFAFIALFLFVLSILFILPFNKIRLTDNIQTIGYISLMLLLFTFSFFGRSLITFGSKYQWLFSIAIIQTRYVGPLVLFLLGGIIYLLFKAPKQIEEKFMLLSSILLIPVFFSALYGHFIYLLFVIFFISLGIKNIIYIKSNSVLKYVAILLVISILFSSFYNHWRTNENVDDWYVSNDIFMAGIWANNYIESDKVGISTNIIGRRFGAISNQHPIMVSETPLALMYGFRNMSDMSIISKSPFTLSFYFDSPYYAEDDRSIDGQINWILQQTDIDYRTTQNILNEYDVSYFIMDTKNYRIVSNSIIAKKMCFYDNNRIKIWDIC